MDEFDSNDGEDWMGTYADAITLLMAFFVLLYSMSTIDNEKYQVLRHSVMEHLGQRAEVADYAGVPEDLETDAAAEDQPTPAGGSDTPPAEEALASSLEASLGDVLAQGGDVRATAAGIMIELPGDVVYRSGSADVRSEALASLQQAIATFKRGSSGDMVVTVEGHTDDQPISTAQFSSNWDLAAVRASRVAELFVSSGVQRKQVRSVSYADTRPKGSNASAAGRARNRRVTILIQDPETANWRPSGGRDLGWRD